jgi:hypothetical protein
MTDEEITIQVAIDMVKFNTFDVNDDNALSFLEYVRMLLS